MTESKITQIDGASLNIAEQRKQELKQLFPGAFTEMRNENGELVEAIDFERLKAELGEFSEIYDNRRERYGMDWPGKRDCLRLIQEPSYATLKPCREESVDFDTTQNLFIEGDNLEVLKLLQKAYYGKIKMIYIDPPYNTGNEFIYPDNYSESLETYLAYAGLVDDEGKKFSTNTKAEGRFHTKWLNMMYPRLYLARNLLREDGVIFISIDDNEVENLRRMCDEIFGEENFIATLVWEKGRKNDARRFSVGHEYILCYARSASYVEEVSKPWRESKPGIETIVRKYEELKSSTNGDFERMSAGLVDFYNSLADDDPAKKYSRARFVDSRGIWRDNNISWPGGGGPKYDLPHPITGRPCKVPDDGWRFIESTMRDKINQGYVHFREDHSQPPMLKSYLYIDPASDAQSYEESGGKLQVMGSVFYRHSQPANDVLKDLFGKKIFENPKDHEVLARLVRYCTTDNDIILDFFSGSSSLAHAVLESNLTDGQSRRYIVVQLPEPCDIEAADGKQFKTIAELGRERLRRVAKGILEKMQSQLVLTEKQDIAFRAFKLRASNFKIWSSLRKSVDDQTLVAQLELSVDHIDPNASQEDILFELLQKSGVQLTEGVSIIELVGHKLFSVADGALLVYLENTIDKELIDAVLEQKPEQFICLDRAFHGNDQLKANAVKTFEAYNQSLKNEDTPIVFRTV